MGHVALFHQCGGETSPIVHKETMMTIYCRGIRGATTAEHNTRQDILDATREMLIRIIEANDLRPEDIASAIFSTTPDLNAEFPAVAARELGWLDTALLCTHEMGVPGSLERCIRVLIHWNTTRAASEIVHVYTGGATTLRPERAVLSHRVISSTESRE
jgi:chorismate mutase